jgi:hypothetical protein
MNNVDRAPDGRGGVAKRYGSSAEVLNSDPRAHERVEGVLEPLEPRE